MGNLAKRFATAGVLVPLVLAAILVDHTPYGILAIAMAVALVGYDEYLRMGLPVTSDDPAWGLRAVGGFAAATLCAGPTILEAWDVLPPILTASTLALSTVVLFRKSQLPQARRHLATALSGLVYVPFLVAVLPLFKQEGNADWLVVTLCAAFFSDTVAYFFGRFLGTSKLYPAVSPKKTRMGALGGVIGGVLATVVVGKLFLLSELPLSHALGLGIFGSAAGQVGDLVASMIKRTFGVKDTGTILPGHGGILDRVDGMLFVGPVFYWYVNFFGR